MNKQQFEQLKENLTNHHRKCVGNAYTADPIFLVRVKKIDWGYEEEYAEYHCIYYDGDEYHTVQDFIDSHDLDDPDEMDYFLRNVQGENNKLNTQRLFLQASTLSQLWHVINVCLPEHEYQYLHGNERWETINWLLTRPEAENFVKRKGGDPDVNIWVDCLHRSNEFQGLLDAVIDDKLVWRDEE